MKIKNHLVIHFVLISIAFYSCGSNTYGDATTASISNAGKKMMNSANYKFDSGVHVLTNDSLLNRKKNFEAHFFKFNEDESVRNMFIQTMQLLDVASLNAAFPKADEETIGIRVLFGLNNNMGLSYYLSLVKFADNVIENGDGYDLVYKPEDTNSNNLSFDYLKNTRTYKVTLDGKLSLLSTNADFDLLQREWSNYLNKVTVRSAKNTDVPQFRRISADDTRSLVIPMQIIDELINNQNPKLKTIYIQSYAVADKGLYKHSVAFLHENIRASFNFNLNIKENENKLKKELTDLSNKYASFEGFKINSKVKSILDKPDFIKDRNSTDELIANLSPEQIVELNLALAPGDQFWGYAADYAQLCPTRCGKLSGSFDAASKLFTIRGFSK